MDLLFAGNSGSSNKIPLLRHSLLIEEYFCFLNAVGMMLLMTCKKKKQMLELSCFTLYISVYSVHLSCRCVSFVYVTEVCSSLSEQFWWTTRVLHFRVLNNCNIRCITNCASFGQILFPNTFCTNFFIRCRPSEFFSDHE